MFKSMIKFGVIAATLVSASAAMAQSHNWGGLYVGGNVGASWGSTDVTSTASCPDNNCPYTLPENLTTIGRLGSGTLDNTEFTAGGQIGYNIQKGLFVYGLEVDFGSFDIGSSQSKSALLPAGAGQTATVRTAISSDWLVTLRGRIGYAVSPSLLVYGTAGVAISELKVSTAYSDNASIVLADVTGSSASSDTKIGFTVGGGVEWALSQNWSVKGEYLYIDFGTVGTNANFNAPTFFAFTPNNMRSDFDATAHIARVGVNYKF